MGPHIVLNDSHGVYIPQLWCQSIAEWEAETLGIQWSDVQACQAGPDHEWYWEAWQAILDSASMVSDGTTWRLHQDGDLWEVPDNWDWEANGWAD
jgi:hypothetical protein